MTRLKLIGLVILIIGLVIAGLLVTRRQLFSNRAFTPGPTTSSDNLFLSPVSGSALVGDIIPVDIKFRSPIDLATNNPIAITSIALKATFPTVGVQVVDALGNPSFQAYPTTLADWTFPVKSVTIASGIATLEFAAVNTNVSGFTAQSDTTLATLYTKVVSLPPSNFLVISLDKTEAQMYPKVYWDQNVAVVNSPTATYSLSAAALPSPTATPSITPTSTVTVTVTPTPLPAGSATITFTPGSSTLPQNTDTTITAHLNTGTNYIDGYQVITTISYSETVPAIDVLGTQVTPLLPGLDCLYNQITHNQTAHSINIAIACAIALADPPYSTQGQTVPVFSFVLHPLSPGSITLPFTTNGNPETLSMVNQHLTGTNLLTDIPSLIYSYDVVITPTPTFTSSPTPSPTSTPSDATILFKLKFQGVVPYAPLPTKNVRLTFRQSGQSDHVLTVSATPDSAGNYVGSVTAAKGIYDLLIKAPIHLQKKFPSIDLSAGETISQDFTQTPLRPGDIAGGTNTFPFDNRVDILDYGLLSTNFQPGVTKTSVADLNFDNLVDILDYGLLVSNFNPSTTGDQ